MSGPAVGARGQIGFSQEGAWGKKQPAPDFFFEMLNEGVVSEIGALISDSLRPDRAVHKRIGGVESAGGDINFEVSAEGFGKLFKHALGSVETTRVDSAFVVKVTDGSSTSALLTVTTDGNGNATNFTVSLTGGSGSGVNIDLGDSTSDTIQELMDEINDSGTGLAAYSASSYQAGGVLEIVQSADYANGTDASNLLQGLSAIELIKNDAGNKDFLVSFGWGVYQHLIDAAPTLPDGMTFEIGRDVAAFTYSGMKVNSMTLTADTGEILNGTFNILGKGATTASRAAAASANTGNAKNAFDIRYSGEGVTCTLDIDKTNHVITIDSATGSEDLVLDISIPWTDPETGIVYPVHTVGGLVAYLNNLSYIICSISDYTDLDADSSYLEDVTATSITGSTLIGFDFDTANLVSEPITWGDYIGVDAGVAKEFVADIVGGGVPGSATVKFSDDGGSTWGDTYTTSATVPTEVRLTGNVDTGFTIFFPDDTALIASDRWTISTFKAGEAASYATLDPFAGFDGALTIDGSEQPIMGWNATLNNNLFADKYHLGSRTRAQLPEQRRSVEGTMNVEFDDLDLYRRFVNGTEGDLIMIFTSDVYVSNTTYAALGNSRSQFTLTIRQPNIEFNGSTPTIADEGIITVDMPYIALYDDVNSIPDLRITLVNNSVYL